MIGWIKSLFGYVDRTNSAAERTAKAWEDIADISEAARDAIRARFAPAIEEGGKKGKKSIES